MGKDFFMISFIITFVALCFFFSRMESAVINVPNACNLVKAIALGQRFPKEGMYCVQFKVPFKIQIKKQLNICLIYYFFFIVQNEWNVSRTNQLTCCLPDLNISQRQAVAKALNENFTLVWGPPGN